MATLNGTEFAGPGWSVPAELWPTAVTRGRQKWNREPCGVGQDANDDWAADVAERALDEAGYYHSWHTKDKTEDK